MLEERLLALGEPLRLGPRRIETSRAGIFIAIDKILLGTRWYTSWEAGGGSPAAGRSVRSGLGGGGSGKWIRGL